MREHMIHHLAEKIARKMGRQHHAHPRDCHADMCHAMAGFGRDRGHGHRGRGRHDDDFDGSEMRGGRRISSDDLQLIVLALIEQKPRHGYDVIKALEAYTHGFYTPSPGMIYPVLTYLEESEQATVTLEGKKKLYVITEEGLAALTKNRERVDAMLSRLERAGLQMQKMRQAYAEEIEGNDMSDTSEGSPLRKTIHALRTLLRGKRFASAEEKQRVTVILQRALKEIEEPGDKTS